MAQQTAVEWLLIWFDNNNYYISSEIAQAFNQAKSMEKEQIKEAFNVGDNCGYRFAITEDSQQFNSGEQYYNETYNK